MRGEIPLEQVYGQRLRLVQPTRAQLAALGDLYTERMVPDARDVVQALQREGLQVRIMSGGLRQAVEPFAAALGVAPSCVAAVDTYFNERGDYVGFEETSPLTRAGGKRELLQLWRTHLIEGAVMFVGDGATDLETSTVADLFVAFAGVAARPAVMNGADVVVRSASLAPIVPLALGGVAPRHVATQTVYDKGFDLLEPVYRSYLGNGTAH